jgi:hypothetical protein
LNRIHVVDGHISEVELDHFRTHSTVYETQVSCDRCQWRRLHCGIFCAASTALDHAARIRSTYKLIDAVQFLTT